MAKRSTKNKTQTKVSLIQKAVVDSAKLTRYAVKGRVSNKKKPVMATDGLVAFVEKGLTSWRLDVSRKAAITPAKLNTPHVTVTADWLDTQQALEKGVEVVHGTSANSFGGMGALLLPDNFNIPTVLAGKENVDMTFRCQ